VADIWIGNPAAKVVLVEYIDHMCEACRQWAPLIEEAYLDFKDDILIILKQYPREKKCNPHITNRLHVGACDSALLAFCAWKKNKYWEFQKVLFAEKPYTTTNTNPKPIEAAKRVGLTDKEIKACLDSKEGLLKIQQDIEDGRALGITSTPGVHINGWHYNGMDSEEHLKYEINYHLNRTSR
jgi:protein-disulfide isomerase